MVVDKADPIHFEVSGSIINAIRNAVDDAVEIMNVPDSSDGVSQFPVQMYEPAYLALSLNKNSATITGGMSI